MAERDRFRNDERWSRDDDWRREGSSNRSGNESRRGFGEGNEDYYRSRDFGSGSRGEFGRGDFGRSSDHGRSDYGQDFGRDYGRGRDYGSSFGDQSFGSDYGRDFGRGDFGRSGNRSGDWNHSSDWNRSDYDRPSSGAESWRDQRGTYGGLGYGGSRSGFGRYGEGSFGGQSSSQHGRDYGSRYGGDFGRSDWQNRGSDWQNRGDDDRGFIERVAEAVSSWFGSDEGQYRHHRGRGPKGYSRSDDRIREDVSDRLGDDWLVDATDIEVAVVNGEVTLSGSVNGREQRRRAEDIAESVSGAKHVQNNIRVSGTTTAGFGNEPGTTSSTGSGASSGTYGSTSTSRKTGSTT